MDKYYGIIDGTHTYIDDTPDYDEVPQNKYCTNCNEYRDEFDSTVCLDCQRVTGRRFRRAMRQFTEEELLYLDEYIAGDSLADIASRRC